MLLDNLRLFAVIVEKGSMVQAAKENGLSATTVSERLAALEAYYGVVLLNRTTRSLSLTDEGRTVLDGARHILDACADLEGRVRHGASTLSGPIRVSAPSDMGRQIVSEVVQQCLDDHPDLQIELLLSDGFVNLVEDGIDLALRFGDVKDSSLRVRSLGLIRRVVCASPSYIEAHGAPKHPEDLARHRCLVMRFGQSLDNDWRFKVGRHMKTFRVSGHLVSNDGALVRAWAMAGKGIVLKSSVDVGPALKNGELVEILSDFAAPAIPLQILFPPSRAQPLRVKELAERLASRFSKLQESAYKRGSCKAPIQPFAA